MADGSQHCDRCKTPVTETMENPKQQVSGVGCQVPGEKEFLCFDCLDKAAPEYVDKYPGWREREQKRGARRQGLGASKKQDPDTPSQKGLFA